MDFDYTLFFCAEECRHIMESRFWLIGILEQAFFVNLSIINIFIINVSRLILFRNTFIC